MPTKIKIDKKAENGWEPYNVEPSEFALIRNDKVNYRLRNDDPNEAFDEFVDFGPRGDTAFLEDIKIALSKEQMAPSFHAFLKCIDEGHIFAIITSRSHEYISIRKGIEYIINKYMYIKSKINQPINYDDKYIKEYLDKCFFYGVGLPFSNSFMNEFNLSPTVKLTIQDAKKLALSKYIEIIHEKQKDFKLGFSDDDKKTISLIKDFFEEKSLIHQEASFYVFDTSDRTIKNGIKHKFSQQ
jgi:hypothetical protein